MATILDIKDVSKLYQKKKILEKVSFTLNEGDIVGLIGKNGSGKTTLMKVILGFTSPSSGYMSFLGDATYQRKSEKLQKIGFLLDCKLFEYLNGYENLLLVQKYSGIKPQPDKIKEMLAFVDLVNNKKLVKSYSFGMKQRLGLALALLGNPQLLILDEPFVGLDPKGIDIFITYIQKLKVEKNIAILISSHQLHEIESICNRFLFIEETQLREITYDKHLQEIELIVDNLPLELIESLPMKMTVQGNSIFLTKENLNDALSFLVNHNIKIRYLAYKENNLEGYFKK